MSKPQRQVAAADTQTSLPSKPYEVVFEDVTNSCAFHGIEILCGDYYPKQRPVRNEPATDYVI